MRPRDGILWHGTPKPFDPEKIEARQSAFLAVFLTDDPVVAAFYAGEGGSVHAYRLSRGADVLDVTRGSGRFEATAEEFAVMDARLRVISPRMTLDGLMSGYFSTGFRRWDYLVPVLGDSGMLGVRLLDALGYKALTRTELYSWALGDRLRTGARHSGAYGEIVRLVCSDPAGTHRATAVIDTSVLSHAATLSVGEIAAAVGNQEGSRMAA